MLATQDSVSYLRGQKLTKYSIYLLLVKLWKLVNSVSNLIIGTMRLSLQKLWTRAFYETVMNRFLDSRFINGHPLRILYLIMTNNENSALEEIRNMINNREMPLFVQKYGRY